MEVRISFVYMNLALTLINLVMMYIIFFNLKDDDGFESYRKSSIISTISFVILFILLINLSPDNSILYARLITILLLITLVVMTIVTFAYEIKAYLRLKDGKLWKDYNSHYSDLILTSISLKGFAIFIYSILLYDFFMFVYNNDP